MARMLIFLVVLLPLSAAFIISSQTSCAGHCNTHFDNSQSCACNTACQWHHDCCHDYQQLCHGGSGSHPGGHNTSTAGAASMGDIMDVLWQKDVNRFSSSDLVYSVQGHTSRGSHADHAPQPLFTHVNEALFSRPTYAAFIALLDNYNPNKGVAETLQGAEEAEVDSFLSAIMTTDVMKTTLKFLQDQGTFTGDEAAFKGEMKAIWFQPYARSGHGARYSSGFEHDFVGEFKSGTIVNGLHNWVRMYLEEKAGHLNYLGYMKQLQPNMLEFTMTWLQRSKPINSCFLGTSPEFDMAMYSLCFLTHPGHLCHFSVQGTKFGVQTYELASVPGLQVATAYTVL